MQTKTRPRIFALALFPVMFVSTHSTAHAGDAQSTLYDATADTVFDIIREDDPTSFICIEDKGRASRQMWDKRTDTERRYKVFLFKARFSDGLTVDVWVNPEFKTSEAAKQEAMRYMKPLGQLPTRLRRGLKYLGIHDGTRGFSAGGGKIFAYAKNAIYRQSYNHLEETLFHEAVHVTFDKRHRKSRKWRKAQKQDGMFLTDYAARHPKREDLAETALFAYGVTN